MKIENYTVNKIRYFKIINDDNVSFYFSSLGATLIQIKDENTYLLRSIDPKEFENPKLYYGKIIGRVANRIPGHEVVVDGVTYPLEANEGENVLHSGKEGLSSKNFSVHKFRTEDKYFELTFNYEYQDLEDNLPGICNVFVTYRVYNHGITVDLFFEAYANKDTPLSLTQHCYFTLGSEYIDDLYLKINADKYLDVDKDLLAKDYLDVTPAFDFRNYKRIAKDIADPALHNTVRLNGYDHFFLFNNIDNKVPQISLKNDKYQMDVYTDFSGTQIYTSNFPQGGTLFPKVDHIRDSVAIEPSDSHKDLHILKAGETYNRQIRYQFKRINRMDNKAIVKQFKSIFHVEPDKMFSCGGRFEILGNHTDHNHGLCLAATCDLNITAAVKKTEAYNTIAFHSQNYPVDVIKLDSLKVVAEEKATSKALMRGIAAYLKDKGYKVGGFIAYSESSIFVGAGVSSSAAFELLVAQIFNELYNDNQIPLIELCKAGKYAENNYFGKASGLLDQIGVAFGNIAYIDFEDIANPHVENVPFPFDDLHFVIINTGGSHAHLSHLYSAIPEDMYSAAKKAGVNFLRETSLEQIQKTRLSDIEYSRSLHFFNENERVKNAVKAIKEKDSVTFLRAINESRISSKECLKNMMVENNYAGSPLEACDYFMQVTGGEGAIKINGGGFAGSVIAVVPSHLLAKVIREMGDKYGQENVREVFVREKGPHSFPVE